MSFFQLLMSFYLCLISVWDVRIRRIPVLLIYAGCFGVFVRLLITCVVCGPSTELVRSLSVALLGAVPGLIMTILSFYSSKVGIGDGIVLIIVGITESCTTIAIVMCLACILLSVLAGILMLFGKVSRNTRMPYIPFVAFSYVLLKLYEGSYFLI